MLFHTWTFAIFFLLMYPVHLAVRGTRLGLYWLLVASYVFYGVWNPLYLALIALATVVDYVSVLGMEKTNRKKLFVSLSIVSNLGLLSFFKYGGFVTENLNALLSSLGVSYAIPVPGMLLPVAMSFYTFKSLTYTIEYYRGRIERERNFVRHAVFVSFFPLLLAGPIERASDLLPQLSAPRRVSKADVAEGLSLFIVGLFKKLALADYLALYVNKVYSLPEEYSSTALVLATFVFGWQIYFDFSGYSDMARGIARMMGFRIMLNFNNPYLATDIGDFWRRWHISLSTWFRDYLYIPLGGNRKGAFRTYLNLFLVMVISGFWHGAAWTFIIWGAVHGVGCMLSRNLERSGFYRERVPKFVKRFWVVSVVTFAWIFFRAESMASVWQILKGMFAFRLADPACPVLVLMWILAVWVYQLAYETKLRRALDWAPLRVGMIIGMVFYMILFASTGNQPFIYLQF